MQAVPKQAQPEPQERPTKNQTESCIERELCRNQNGQYDIVTHILYLTVDEPPS